MIILTCPECQSPNIGKTDNAEGLDEFYCKDCNKKFLLELSSHREEKDLFE